MFHYSSHKKAFAMAALIIVLCLICIVGATLALFTNRSNDGTIGIITTAGNVRVDIVNTYDGETLVGKTLDFQTSSEQKEIFFEPGATFYTQGFKVKNTGDIPVNFRLTVSDDVDIDMEKFKSAFDLWISTDPTDPKKAEPLPDFVGHLEVGQSTDTTYYLFVKMNESAGHEFKGKKYTGIGVTVCAVQGNVNIEEIDNNE